MGEPKKDIGVWEKQSKEGKKYWGGKLPDGRFFSMFLNEYKREGDNQPTFKILINEAKVQTVSFTPSAPAVEEDLPF